MSALDKINHVVVLMLENRSFDNLLGRLYPPTDRFDGLTGSETNPDGRGGTVKVWNRYPSTPVPPVDIPASCIPNPDPGELFTDMNTQLFGKPDAPGPAPKPTMNGFVINYIGECTKNKAVFDPTAVMHYFLPEEIPVISRLARQFAVSDRWFASAPCQTWPNRFFMHTATANGYENNTPVHFPYLMPTIFDRMQDMKTPGGWKIYFHDFPQSLTLTKLWPYLDNFRFIDEFKQDAANGGLPAYAFIEPRYFADTALPNDAHPPHNVTLADQLVAEVYNAVRSGPGWTETLLIITCDEHGGCYDHVTPGPAVPPSKTPTLPFNFDRYGVRVPAVLISPYIPQGTILRPDPDSKYPFDHTSVIATLMKRFHLGAPLTERDAAAPTLDSALTLATASNMGPESVDYAVYVPSPRELFLAKSEKPNAYQQSLVELAAHLPAAASTGDFTAFVQNHLAMTAAGIVGAPSTPAADVDSALQFVKGRLGNMFKSI